MRTPARHDRVRGVAGIVTGALLLAVTGTAAPAFADDRATPTPSASTTAIPLEASEATKSAVLDVQQRLVKLTKEAAATKAQYVAATARLSLARRTSQVAARRAVVAAGRVDLASRQLGELAADSYRAGPMAGAEAVLGSSTPAQLLHTASVIDVVATHQAQVLTELREARNMASVAEAQARAGRRRAAKAVRDTQRLKRVAHHQLVEAGELLAQLRARAVAEAAAAAAAEQERLSTLMQTLTASLAAAPLAATATGPTAGLPAQAGPDPGDGPQGVDHLRPRAERARALIIALFGVTDIGGWRPSDSISDDHPNGRALDVMMSADMAAADPAHVALGWQVARWAQANAVGLGVTYVIWQARIWSVARSADGWRDYTTNFPYGSQVNATTLHLNHVHISFG